MDQPEGEATGMNFYPVRLLHGIPDAGDIGTKEHKWDIAQDTKNQTKYSQSSNQKGIEFSGHTLQSNSRKGDGRYDQNKTEQIEGG